MQLPPFATRRDSSSEGQKPGEVATETIAENQKQVGDIISRAPEIVATTHNVVTRLDDFVDDVSVRAKTQLDRLELVRDDAMERIHHSAEMIDTVLTPVRGVSEAADGVRAVAKLLNRTNAAHVPEADRSPP
jgi:ABC-type transporter Mla subunit MlaD